MNTILAICCQLAIFYTNSCPVWGDIEYTWSLTEASIRTDPVSRMYYTNRVSLILSDKFYYNILADVNDNGVLTDVLRFKMEEFNSFVDDTIFVIPNDGSNRVARLKFAYRNEAERLVCQVFATTHVQPQYKYVNEYMIAKLSKADRLGNTISMHFLDRVQPIYFTIFAGFDENGDETEERRFIVHGGAENKLFVVFDQDEFNIIRGVTTKRYLLVVKSPGDFEEMAYYGLMFSVIDNSPEMFGDYIMDYVSSDIVVPEALFSYVNNL